MQLSQQSLHQPITEMPPWHFPRMNVQKKILTGIRFQWAGIRPMKKKPWLGLKLLRKSMRMDNILIQKNLKKN